MATKLPLKLYVEDAKIKERFREILGQRAPQFTAALVQVVQKSWALQKCTPESVAGAAITAAALDLSLDPNLGEAHLVPYADSCMFQIGYKGLTQLALRSGQYHRLGWMIIRAGQLVKWDELTGELEVDKAAKTGDDTIGYAAKFRLVNGFERGAYWTKEEVKAHSERYSQAVKKGKQDSPWYTHFDVMALKTVLRDLLIHWGPKSIQLQKAFATDGQVFKAIDTSIDVDTAREEEQQQVEETKEAVKETIGNVAAGGNVTKTEPKDEPGDPQGEAADRAQAMKDKNPLKPADTSVVPGPVADLIGMLEGVKFDDFKVFAKLSCQTDLDEYPSYEDLPVEFCASVLTKYSRQLGKFITAYRK